MQDLTQESKMHSVKLPDKRTMNKCRKERRVLAVIGDGCHGLWVVRSLGENDLCVLTVCSSPQGRARYSRYSAGAWALEASPDEPEFISEIEKLARLYDVGSIMTISEANHLALIENRDRFEPEIHIFSPPADAFNKVIDKDYMLNLCKELDVPIAKGMILEDYLESPLKDLKYPLIMRTRQQLGEQAHRNAPWKVAYAMDDSEFNALVEQVSNITDNIILQEYHMGVAYNMNIVMRNGRPFFAAVFKGELDYPIAGGVTVQRVSCEPGDPYPHAEKLLAAVNYEGNAGVDFRFNNDTGEYIFTEINPRFEGGTGTLVRAGYHIPFLTWQSHFEPDQMKEPHFRPGIRTRDFKGSLGWLKQMLDGAQYEPGKKRPSKLGAIAIFLWHCGPWTHDDTFWWRDPKPFIMERFQMFAVRLLPRKRVGVQG